MTDLRTAAQHAFEALDQINSPLSFREVSRVGAALSALRAALAQPEPRNQCGETCERAKLCAVCARGIAEDAMQRLTNEQQEIDDHLRDATKMMATSQESRQVEPVGYGVFEDGNLHDSFRLEYEAKLFAALKGEHAEVGALHRSPPNQSEDTLGMVEPVAWMCSDETMCRSGYERFSRVCEGPWNIPVYTAPTKRKPLTDEQIMEIFINSGRCEKTFARAIERAHGIGGEE